jgi:hypothetical protein
VGNELVLIEPPRLPITPFAPERRKILLLAIAMGVVLGLGSAVVMEYLDLTMKSVEEIELVLGLPVLGAVPKMQAAVLHDVAVKRQHRLRVFAAAMVLTALAIAVASYLYFFQANAVG